jgi:integration host factor subunit alpha
MAENTVTRTDLCEAVYQKVGLSRTECAAFVELDDRFHESCHMQGDSSVFSDSYICVWR